MRSTPLSPRLSTLSIGLLILILATVASAATTRSAKRTPAPATTANRLLPAAYSLSTLSLQLALEREGFSPGVLDGRPGTKTTLALQEFQRARSLPITGQPDSATLGLLQVPSEPTTTYTIQPQDVSQVTGVPTSWQAKSKMKYLGYPALADAIAEKHHCSRALLGWLNPRANLTALKAGDVLRVPAIPPATPRPASRLEINLSQKAVRAFDSREQLVGLFHCSIAANAAKRPSGQARIVTVSPNPTYRFDPAMWPEVKTVKTTLLIPPGPRNPVGLCWIGLSLRGYGIHGSPNPELIGKTGSHGCFRLTNWDAVKLGQMVRPGAAVKFLQS